MIASCERFRVGRLDDDHRHLVQLGALRRAPAPFAGDDLELVVDAAQRPHHDRLDDAALAHRSGELFELGVGERAARIARVGPQRAGRQPPLPARPVD